MSTSHLSISTDRQHRVDGLTRIWDERRNAYVTDERGDVLTFPQPYDAQQWVERQWANAHGVAL